MRLLSLSAYAADSHVYWQQTMERMFPSWDWEVLSLPARHFSWRVRGNPLYWSLQETDRLQQDYDLLIATSMVDLATLRGLVPHLASIPSIVYFHENQFEYPSGQRRYSLLEAQMVSIYSALAADRVVFNSRYNKSSFLQGCSRLMDKLPDRVPPQLMDVLDAKASVLPVPCEAPPVAQTGSCWPWTQGQLPQRALRLCWVGRFEHDKGGDGLLQILHHLEERKIHYELAVTGQQFRQSPAVFDQIQSEFTHRIVQFGYVESKALFGTLLSGADLVLSTSHHEFQGLAVIEAVASGCLPVLPARLVYPEIYPSQFMYTTDRDDQRVEAAAATELILSLARLLTAGNANAPDLSAFSSESLMPEYAGLFKSVAAARSQ